MASSICMVNKDLHYRAGAGPSWHNSPSGTSTLLPQQGKNNAPCTTQQKVGGRVPGCKVLSFFSLPDLILTFIPPFWPSPPGLSMCLPPLSTVVPNHPFVSQQLRAEKVCFLSGNASDPNHCYYWSNVHQNPFVFQDCTTVLCNSSAEFHCSAPPPVNVPNHHDPTFYRTPLHVHSGGSTVLGKH